MRFARLILLLWAGPLLAQSGAAVNIVQGPPPQPWTVLYYYTGSNLVNICSALAFQSVTRWSVGDATLTNITVATNVGTINFAATAQVWIGQTVTVAGSATTALNKSYKITAVSGSTATITTSGVSDGTYTDASLSTQGPVLNGTVWAIQVFHYTGSTLDETYWAGTPTSGSPAHNLACSSRASY